MSWRREHSRTNRYGTTFKVRGHSFNQGKRDGAAPFKLSYSDGEAYVNGSLTFNIKCPGCGSPVFFYQNGHGSRVFFDELGKPWPKHRCTNWDPVFETAPIAIRSWVLYADASGAKTEEPVINVHELCRKRRLSKKQRKAQHQRDELDRAVKQEKLRQENLDQNKAAWKAAGSPMPKRQKRAVLEVRRKKNLEGR